MDESKKECLMHLHGVSKSFAGAEKKRLSVLKDIDLELHAGEIVAILGKSGCGKSTLLRILAGLTRPTSGKVLYRGKHVDHPEPGISMVFQTFALFPWLNVLQNVELGLEAQGIEPVERRQRALEVIDMIGLDGFESAFPKELSGGMRQRVGFARALVVNPDILLMDEAFSALDVPTSETLRNDLLDLWIERLIPTRAILMVSHNIEEALLMADRVIVFDSNPGRVKAEVAITLKHPRDRESLAFRQLVERIYTIMTTTVIPNETESAKAVRIGIGHPLPSVTVAQMTGAMEEILHLSSTGSAELPVLAVALQLEIDNLFPILDALVLLDFAVIASGVITLSRHGKAFVDADILRRKEIFGEHQLKRVPLAGHIRRVLDERPSQRAPEQRFLRELEDYLSEEEAERVLAVVIDWGRYAELFAYDYNSGILSTENPGEEVIE
ncbi:ABC transporter ATP-binding protein [Sulfurirhabdus autotrophica]|uniref:NitT/TauT family transport system ATP-binding protein n=1 Tax=Sulfurirhabdus autotrophica TaxID=1706046 RepID=A0A4R3Y3U5_9PROT|nr:nitrate/sulfonate/bicarbonate ABC transporter ATP-binding protein [Sulfurirhabdus autotrophica]TCV86426.1 NitT/TauT family transport system ATP-binding protein [Sulfurirhabdus autotrophica]